MAEAPSEKRPPYKRKLSNYLLDKRFQLKYAGLLAGIAAVLSLTLGLLLWNTSKSLVAQSRTAVETGQQAVTLGTQVTAESKKVSEVVEMNIVKDPLYGDNPELLAEFKADSDKKNRVLIDQQATLEAQAKALSAASAKLASDQQNMMLTLLTLLSLLVVAIGFVGIVVTHKVAGPIFKMTRLFRDLGDGHWREPAPLRKGDELVQFFEAFAAMVKNLRGQREHELELLDSAVATLEADGAEELGGQLDELRREMDKALHGES